MIQELSFKNHYQFGFNNIPYSSRESKSDSWFVRFGIIEKKLNLKDACIRAWKIIANKGIIPTICFSGGIDSEFAILTAIESKIDFKIAIMEFEENLNDYDITYAFNFCQLHNLKYDTYNLNLLDWWKSEECEYFLNLTKVILPSKLATMWLMLQIAKRNEFPVLAQGEPKFVKNIPGDIKEFYNYRNIPKSPWFLYEREQVQSWYYFLLKNNINGIAGFYQYTPEQIEGFINNQIMQDVINEKYLEKKIFTSEKIKWELYQQYYSNLITRPKFHGYEKVKDYFITFMKKNYEKFQDYDSIYKIRIDRLAMMLNGYSFDEDLY